jgi:tetratricopeptide (TPR) repeat protein
MCRTIVSVLSRLSGPRIWLWLLILTTSLPAHAADEKWLRVSSDHFTVLTDANQKKGHEIAARFEQMRSAFAQLLMRKQVRMSEPIEIIAVADPAKYGQLAPLVNGHPITAPGFWLAGEDRIYIVLDATVPDCWRAVEHPLAHYLLNYNYPPTQPWFDEGLAEYFASLYFTLQKTELGSDPVLSAPGSVSRAQSASTSMKSLTEILNQPVWMNLSDLLETENRALNGEEGTSPTQFYAQSWMLVHYLINKDKLSETGAYFGLVELQKVPVAQAVQQAFGMPIAQLEQSVKDYFHSLKPLAASLEQPKKTNGPAMPQPVNESPLPFSIDDVSTTTNQVLPAEAIALVDEMQLRIPERRDQAVHELEKLASGDRTETAAAHRALAWAHIRKGETKEAFEELSSAMQITSSDPWTRFGLALASYHSGEKGAKIQGLANMMESLQIVIDRYPEFAEAYNMLGWARLTGGGANAAVETMKMAVQLNPRSEQYQLRLAKAYVAARKWDEGGAILDRLQGSQDPQIVAAAKKDLHDLPYLKKFGIPPQEESPPKEEAKTQEKDDLADEDADAVVKQIPGTPKINKRPIQFLKAKLLSVDCSEAPKAVLLVAKGPKTLKLRTRDYKSLVVLGADKFSCDWKDQPVSVNYRGDAKGGGDLVSIEVQ